ncbi:MAG TPA: hypothetical protein VK633_15885, partial [Verrucomicrobiae bacterium]|nr:hypothetical protein [Verrucomicrobiae bacterium]
MTARFTIDGSNQLEARLSELCALARDGVSRLIPEKQLTALLLAGGYGRGEGGVLDTAEGDQPYNDMEFYVLVSGNELLAQKRYGGALHHLGAEMSVTAGIDIEFKILALRKLEVHPVSMFYYDLVT